MRKIYISVMLSFVVAGCAATNEIVQVGKDTYMVSGWGKSPGGYTGAEVKGAAIREATKFCANQGKQLQVISSAQNDMRFGVLAAAELQFMCLASSDADFKRSTVQRESDQVLEVRKDIKINESVNLKTNYDELLKLDDLRKRGIITEEEFAAQKTKLFNR